MVDAFLTIAAVVILILLLVVNTYLLALYQHPEDRGFGASVAPKIIVVIGLTLSCVKCLWSL
jgi:nitrogen fixation/metabolism regulation signal transduction histidine kinase